MKYQDGNRGKIQYRNYASQIIDFSGIRIGNITPTDIDGLIEFKNRAFVLLEYKRRGGQLPHGQKLALTRMVDRLTKGGSSAILLVCVHDTNAPCDIDGANAIVESAYMNEKWFKGRQHTVIREIEGYLEWLERFEV